MRLQHANLFVLTEERAQNLEQLLKLIRPCRDRKISRQNKTPSILRFHI